MEMVKAMVASISIHAPREGGDFAPRSAAARPDISIHAPREGGDARHSRRRIRCRISIHAPREGGDVQRRAVRGVTG